MKILKCCLLILIQTFFSKLQSCGYQNVKRVVCQLSLKDFYTIFGLKVNSKCRNIDVDRYCSRNRDLRKIRNVVIVIDFDEQTLCCVKMGEIEGCLNAMVALQASFGKCWR